MKSHYAQKRDDNEKDIIKDLTRAGAFVQQITQGAGVPDLLVGFRGTWFLIEIKDGNKVPSKQKLTEPQQKWFDSIEGIAPAYVANSTEQALKIIGAI